MYEGFGSVRAMQVDSKYVQKLVLTLLMRFSVSPFHFHISVRLGAGAHNVGGFRAGTHFINALYLRTDILFRMSAFVDG